MKYYYKDGVIVGSWQAAAAVPSIIIHYDDLEDSVKQDLRKAEESSDVVAGALGLVDKLKAENAELRLREAAMRETSYMWMVRSISMEAKMKKAGVCWYA